jgi:hypothetical protein
MLLAGNELGRPNSQESQQGTVVSFVKRVVPLSSGLIQRQVGSYSPIVALTVQSNGLEHISTCIVMWSDTRCFFTVEPDRVVRKADKLRENGFST